MVAHEQVAYRFRLAQSWWIASELARRNRQLFVYEYHPGGGQSDSLALLDRTGPQSGSVIDLNRVGGLHVHKPEYLSGGTWADAFDIDDPHQVIKTLEKGARLSPISGQPTTPETLVYRIIARILASMVDDRHRWDVRSDAVDSSGYGEGPRGYLEQFPLARTAAKSFPLLDWWNEPHSHVWALLRNEKPVALFDVHGQLHTPTESIELMPVYRACGSNLGRTIAATVGKLLP